MQIPPQLARTGISSAGPPRLRDWIRRLSDRCRRHQHSARRRAASIASCAGLQECLSIPHGRSRLADMLLRLVSCAAFGSVPIAAIGPPLTQSDRQEPLSFAQERVGRRKSLQASRVCPLRARRSSALHEDGDSFAAIAPSFFSPANECCVLARVKREPDCHSPMRSEPFAKSVSPCSANERHDDSAISFAVSKRNWKRNAPCTEQNFQHQGAAVSADQAHWPLADHRPFLQRCKR